MAEERRGGCVDGWIKKGHRERKSWVREKGEGSIGTVLGEDEVRCERKRERGRKGGF